MALIGRKAQTSDAAASPAATTDAAVKLTPKGGLEDIEVAGENHHRDEVAAMFQGWGYTDGGVKMCQAVMVAEPSNKYDRNAVKVLVDGHHIGYIPGEYSESFAATLKKLKRGQYLFSDARAWGTNEDGTWRARVTLIFDGTSEAERDYGADRRAYEAKVAAKDATRAEREAVKEQREAAKVAGSIGGIYWANYKPAIAEMKKQGQLDAAHALMLQCATAAEAEARALGSAPDAWPTWQLCVLHEKSRDRAAAVAALDRYVAACGDEPLPDKIVQLQMKFRVTGAPVAQSESEPEREPETEPVEQPAIEPESGPVEQPASAPPLPSPATPELPPANWYPDPHGTPGLLRYWDGARWTDHTHAQA